MHEEIINALIISITGVYGTRLKSIILFGSVARNTAVDGSDVDIAVLVDTDDVKRYEEQLLDITVELDLKYDKVFSVIGIEYHNFLQWENILPFYKNIKKDGIILWQAM